MRKIIVFFLIGAAYYIASMYRQLPLMVLALTELFLLAVLFFLPRYWRKRVKLSFFGDNGEAVRGRISQGKIRVQNGSRLPLRYLRVWLTACDESGGPVEKIRLHRDMGSSGGELTWELRPDHCGVLRLRMERVRIYDYLSVFSAKKSLEEEMSVLVLPRSAPLRFGAPEDIVPAHREELVRQERALRYAGEENKEVRQIREYRMGDSGYRVHWNQSAKTGKLWIKEYEREDDNLLELLLDIRLPSGWPSEQRDGFYEGLWALLLGLLQAGRRVMVSWYETARESFETVRVENEEQCRRLFAALYRIPFVEPSEAADLAYAGRVRPDVMRWNLSLECYYGEELRYRFAYEDLERQLSQTVLPALW